MSTGCGFTLGGQVVGSQLGTPPRPPVPRPGDFERVENTAENTAEIPSLILMLENELDNVTNTVESLLQGIERILSDPDPETDCPPSIGPVATSSHGREIVSAIDHLRGLERRIKQHVDRLTL